LSACNCSTCHVCGNCDISSRAWGRSLSRSNAGEGRPSASRLYAANNFFLGKRLGRPISGPPLEYSCRVRSRLTGSVGIPTGVGIPNRTSSKNHPGS
jgi:hypothetical protein